MAPTEYEKRRWNNLVVVRHRITNVPFEILGKDRSFAPGWDQFIDKAQEPEYAHLFEGVPLTAHDLPPKFVVWNTDLGENETQESWYRFSNWKKNTFKNWRKTGKGLNKDIVHLPNTIFAANPPPTFRPASAFSRAASASRRAAASRRSSVSKGQGRRHGLEPTNSPPCFPGVAGDAAASGGGSPVDDDDAAAAALKLVEFANMAPSRQNIADAHLLDVLREVIDPSDRHHLGLFRLVRVCIHRCCLSV
ncbi:hypothetical protein BC937DRAFT_86123 [Endogone sp. FLAS-F59071]|nr:hypothetical protein BC937DRAFT_86123 [Endogone sp. FLAS-F59071]|eukprot:RUS23438.1 hypothetical protein BC937DRAFT_86123 [Endogone sp. FLAS-F59071]